jgi:hypothetical protein
MVNDLMDGPLGAGNQGAILTRRIIGADRIEDHAALAGVQADIVIAVVPGQHFLFHGVLVERADAGHLAKLLELALELFVRSTHPGRVLEVELRHQYGRPVYTVELVDAHGVVWYLQFDATQGFLLHEHREKWSCSTSAYPDALVWRSCRSGVNVATSCQCSS